MAERHPREWRELAQSVAEEQDPNELLKLVQELNEALDAEEAGRKIARPLELNVRRRRSDVKE